MLTLNVKLAYTSTHTNKSFLSQVSIKLFESSQLFLNFVQNLKKTVMTQKLMWLHVSRKVQLFISRMRGHSKHFFEPLSLQYHILQFFYEPSPPVSFTKTLKKMANLDMNQKSEGYMPVGKKTSTRCLKGVLPRQARHLAKTSCRCPKDVLNANLEDIFIRHLEETLAR